MRQLIRDVGDLVVAEFKLLAHDSQSFVSFRQRMYELIGLGYLVKCMRTSSSELRMERGNLRLIDSQLPLHRFDSLASTNHLGLLRMQDIGSKTVEQPQHLNPFRCLH